MSELTSRASIKLTVAIPTWNRPVHLRRTVEALIPQLREGCHILIIDNASDTPAATVLSDLLTINLNGRIQIVRNVINIGGEPNILRCVEHCRTDWIWLLGDDDTPRTDAIDTILHHIESNPDAVYLNFSLPGVREKTVKGRSNKDLIRAVDYLDLVQWISVCVYKTQAAQQAINPAFFYMSMSVSFVLAFFSVGSDGEFVISAAPIIQSISPAEWSKLDLMLTIGTLLSLPIGPAERTALSDKILGLIAAKNPRQLYFYLATTLRDKEYGTILYYFDQVYSRLLWHHRGIRIRTEYAALRWMIRHPITSNHILSIYRYCRKQLIRRS